MQAISLSEHLAEADPADFACFAGDARTAVVMLAWGRLEKGRLHRTAQVCGHEEAVPASFGHSLAGQLGAATTFQVLTACI